MSLPYDPRANGGRELRVSPARPVADGGYGCETDADPRDLPAILAAAAAAAGWREARTFAEVQQFTATRTMRLKHNIGSRSHELTARWVVRGDGVAIFWLVVDAASQFHRVPDPDAMARFGEALAGALRQYRRAVDSRPAVPHDPVVAPGTRWRGQRYTGDLYDYGRLARPEALTELTHGLFPLGRYAFPGLAAPRLFLPETPDPRSRELLRNRGVLLCAPTRSGKTSLIRSWAESAIADGFSTVILDPKGSLYPKLKRRLERSGVDAEIYYFTTDPRSGASDGINFLEGLKAPGLDDRAVLDDADPADSDADPYAEAGEGSAHDRLRQVVAALLPRFRKAEGEEGFRRTLHRDWALATLIILKLAEHHFPDDFTTTAPDGSEIRRAVDLSDLYLLAAREERLIRYIEAIRGREREIAERGMRLEVDSVEDHVTTLATALDPEALPGEGKRRRDDFYENYALPLRLALAPFHKGALARRTSDEPGRRRFSFDRLGDRNRPVTLVLAARSHDKEPADAVLQLTIARLSQIVLDRLPSEGLAPARPPGKLALFLDETARIRSFDAATWFETAAEAGVMAVVVYQSLARIGNAELRDAVLRNVGFQIYLGNVRGGDTAILNAYLGEREQSRPNHGESRSESGRTTTIAYQQVAAPFLSPAALYRFPGGDYPALVVTNDDRHAPFITDLFDPMLATD